MGSSPRVRGKLRDKKKGKERRGLIPARAGKTSARCPSPQSPQAHPRACGENLESRSIAPLAIGSSPRVRGKLAAVLDDPARTGLIPARAGKTSWRIVPLMEHEAHPRACGENLVSGVVLHLMSGSSPRVRGKLGGDAHRVERPGLIPARAGKTASFVPIEV